MFQQLEGYPLTKSQVLTLACPELDSSVQQEGRRIPGIVGGTLTASATLAYSIFVE